MDRFPKIFGDSDDRIRTVGPDKRIQRLILGGIIIRHEFYAKVLAVMYIIQIHIDNRLLRLFRVCGSLQKIRVDTGLFLNVIGEEIILGFKVMIKASVGDAGFLADILNRELLIPFLLQDVLRRAEDLSFRFLGF